VFLTKSSKNYFPNKLRYYFSKIQQQKLFFSQLPFSIYHNQDQDNSQLFFIYFTFPQLQTQIQFFFKFSINKSRIIFFKPNHRKLAPNWKMIFILIESSKWRVKLVKFCVFNRLIYQFFVIFVENEKSYVN